MNGPVIETEEQLESLLSEPTAEVIETLAHLPGDLLDASYADSLAAAAFAALGGLDILVNNAGVITRGSVANTTDADWALSLGVNVEAPFRVCRGAIPIMADRGGGAIVNVSSCWGVRPGPIPQGGPPGKGSPDETVRSRQ